MRRSLFRMGLLALGWGLVALTANAAVYEAPHYSTAVIMTGHQQGGSWGGDCGQTNCGQSNCGGASCHYCPSPATKLTRGITNVITGPLELPKYLITGAFNCNVQPLDGLGVGLVRGTSRAIERVGIGFWEVATFPFPDFEPLLCPEFISLEPCLMNWRYGNYTEMPCGICCNPCQGAASYMGVRPAPQQQAQPPVQPENPAPAFERQLQSQAPPPPTNLATPGNAARRGGGVTYPDDYLK